MIASAQRVTSRSSHGERSLQKHCSKTSRATASRSTQMCFSFLKKKQNDTPFRLFVVNSVIYTGCSPLQRAGAVSFVRTSFRGGVNEPHCVLFASLTVVNCMGKTGVTILWTVVGRPVRVFSRSPIYR